LDVRLFLYTSDNTATPAVTNINITSDSGFETSGNWVSNQYNSTYSDLNWDIVTFVTAVPSGATLAVKARAANSLTELDAASYGSAITSGDDADVIGQYLQFKVELGGDSTVTPNIDVLRVRFTAPSIQTITP